MLDAFLFVAAATALLGSPGPGIAALVAVGRTGGLSTGLRFFTGMQVGLALAAGLSAAGLISMLLAVPLARTVLTALSAGYLAWLAWSIATAPAGDGAIGGASEATASFGGGFLLGFANPKAYLAFLSLFASFTILGTDADADAALKWLLCVAVMLVVDFGWLCLGAALGRIRLGARKERALNVAMGGTILIAAGLALA